MDDETGKSEAVITHKSGSAPVFNGRYNINGKNDKVSMQFNFMFPCYDIVPKK